MIGDLEGGVLPGGARGTRTTDPLLANYARSVGYRRSPGLAPSRNRPGSARAGSCCGQAWWSAWAAAMLSAVPSGHGDSGTPNPARKSR